jgi:type IV secretory pathway VirB10-like protein
MALPQRKRKSQAKINLLISIVFHVLVGGGLLYLAARQGVLGNKMREITAFRVKEEKPPEPQKPKEEPKPEEPKPEVAQAPRPQPTTTQAPPPNQAPPPTAISDAPPAASAADFNFSDGAKVIQTPNDPIEAYKGFVEFSIRSRWNKPEGVDDSTFVAEVEVSLAPDGKIERYEWKSQTADKTWNNSIGVAMAATKNIGRPLPKGFPSKFLVRFDAVADTEAVQ